ncbi:Flagellar hook-length control protein FliK [Thalassoglobus polymorphus]|uniref:Flagellar hook-length control protein FliK n=2 Tax=Thalassoglobus polymorphus TaxID=2527994 RepID=A0A517QME8_9PLAN|nr:Flagellar hook-length control protein FliK [Thalassoglobus polymorphus]
MFLVESVVLRPQGIGESPLQPAEQAQLSAGQIETISSPLTEEQPTKAPLLAKTPLITEATQVESSLAGEASQYKNFAPSQAELLPQYMGEYTVEETEAEAAFVDSTDAGKTNRLSVSREHFSAASSLNSDSPNPVDLKANHPQSSNNELLNPVQQGDSQHLSFFENSSLIGGDENRFSSITDPTSVAGKVIQKVVAETMAQLSAAQSKIDSSFSVRLDPPELGEVLVRLKKTEGGLMMRIVAIDPTTQQLLEHHETELSESLQSEQPEQSELSMELGDRSEFQRSDQFYDWETNENWLGNQPSRSGINSNSSSVQTRTQSTNPHDFMA